VTKTFVRKAERPQSRLTAKLFRPFQPQQSLTGLGYIGISTSSRYHFFDQQPEHLLDLGNG